MRFRLVPKSVTLNDLEWRNNPYFALFHLIRVQCRRKNNYHLMTKCVRSCRCEIRVFPFQIIGPSVVYNWRSQVYNYST